MVKILYALIAAVTAFIMMIDLKRPVHEPFSGWRPPEGSPCSVHHTWPCTGTEVFLERPGRLGPAEYRHA